MTAERTPERAVRAAALRRDLMRRMELGNLDELLVLDQHWQRIELGRDRYGLLDLRASRDWEREELEEHLDAATYRACARVQRRELELEASFHLGNTPGDALAIKVSTSEEESLCASSSRSNVEDEIESEIEMFFGKSPRVLIPSHAENPREKAYAATGETPAQSAMVATASEQNEDRRVDLDTAPKYTAPVDNARDSTAVDPVLGVGGNSSALAFTRDERHPAGGLGWDLSDLDANALGEGEG